ncbi:ATPase [Sphingobium aquiterrae]|uniref:ATPase n=1 Tax=Sphingobium aquiterrae TaxID=2038656 RepID=UPI003017CD00
MTIAISARRAVLATMLVTAPPVFAAVLTSSESGFVSEASVDLPLSPVEAYALVATPARWWNGAHSYSGDAKNLTIEAWAGGCFCEALPAVNGKPAGSVEHGRVLLAMPGDMLRISGGLGPLQGQAVVGTLTFSFAPSAAGMGKGTKVTMRYVVGGYVEGGAAKLAPAVDMVLGQQLQGLSRVAGMPMPR